MTPNLNMNSDAKILQIIFASLSVVPFRKPCTPPDLVPNSFPHNDSSWGCPHHQSLQPGEGAVHFFQGEEVKEDKDPYSNQVN